MDSIFGGGNDNPPEMQRIPDPPSVEDQYDVLDFLSNLQKKTVKDPVTGKKRIVVERIKLPPEEEEILQKAQTIVNDSFNKVIQLSKSDPSLVIPFMPVIEALSNLDQKRQRELSRLGTFADITSQVNAFKEMKTNLVERDYLRQEREMETSLAQRGMIDSSLAEERRARLQANRDQALREVDVQGDIYGREIQKNDYAVRSDYYNKQEGAMNRERENAILGYEGAKDENLQRTAQKDRLSSEALRNMGIGLNVKGEDFERAIRSRGLETAFNEWNAEESHKTNRYAGQVAAINANNQNALAQHQAQPPSLGSTLVNLGAKGLSAYMTGGM